MVDRGEVVGRDEGELGRLRSVVGGRWAHGGRPALVAVGEEGVEIWTYGELAGRVLGLGRGLRGAGVERGDHVALLAANSKEWVAACLAVISAGAVVVPSDAQLGDEALLHVLEDSGAGHIFTTEDQAGRLESVDAGAGLRTILLDVGEDDRRSWRCLLTDEDVDLPPAGPGDVAALFYTSGTTGAAKGVPLSHANLVFQIDTLLGADLVSEDDRVLLPLPLHHVYPFVMGMLAPLAAGLPIVLPQSLTDPQLVRSLREGEATLSVTSCSKNVQPEAVEVAYLENPLIREIGVLQKDGRLVAIIVPEMGEISRGTDIHRVMREAVEEGSKRLPSYQ